MTEIPNIVAHRGASAAAPENTFRAFDLAIAQGAKAIELDVHLAQDGEVMVIHDDALARTTNGYGLVESYTAEQLQLFDAGDGERIPTLRNVLEYYAGQAMFWIELKHVRAAPMVVALVDGLVADGLYSYDQLVVISSLHEALSDIRSMHDEVVIGATFYDEPMLERLAQVVESSGAKYILPEYSLVGQDLVERAKKLNVGVIAWTVNDMMHIEALRAIGVTAIITDVPDQALEVPA